MKHGSREYRMYDLLGIAQNRLQHEIRDVEKSRKQHEVLLEGVTARKQEMEREIGMLQAARDRLARVKFITVVPCRQVDIHNPHCAHTWEIDGELMWCEGYLP